MTVLPNGTSVIAAGLDSWFDPTGDYPLDTEEFEVEEWRLQRTLQVSHFRLPPDYRRKRFGDKDARNLYLTVPFLRFPTWNFCPKCRRLSQLPLSFENRKPCDNCMAQSQSKKGPLVAQVPVVAVCEYGHIQDFPWAEWVHGSATAQCAGDLSLIATGGASLAAQSVKCSCGKSRSLSGVTEAAAFDAPGYPETYLSKNLDPDGGPYLCRGVQPWYGTEEATGCDRHLRGSLRAASNVYFSLVKSSIYLPRETGAAPPKVVEILSAPPLSTFIQTAREVAGSEPTVAQLRNQRHADLLGPFSDEQVEAGLAAVSGDAGAGTSADAPSEPDDSDPDEEDVEFRWGEFRRLREPCQTEALKIREADRSEYESQVSQWLSKVMLVDQLRETRALWGFNRVLPDGQRGLRDRRGLLWHAERPWNSTWLPAYVVNGEGLFVELDPERVRSWEQSAPAGERAAQMQSRYEAAKAARGLRERELTPRFVLLHTLAHILMNRLTYECGYSSAALRERLYVGQGAREMAGVLIYTAAGDAEGTMGGLVRMGRPGYLEPALRAALDAALWCSADPVCMDIGEAGQGPDSCNMAACHGCALVPETACEEFNRFLDRGMLVGTREAPSLGFFSATSSMWS